MVAESIDLRTWGQVRGFLAEKYPRVSIAQIAREFGESRQTMSWRINDDRYSAPTADFVSALLATLKRIAEETER